MSSVVIHSHFIDLTTYFSLNSRRSLNQDDKVSMNTFQVAAGIGATTTGTGTSSGEDIGPMEFSKNKVGHTFKS